MAGLSKIDGFKIWTSPVPERSVAVVSFQPGSLDTRKLLAALYEKDKIAVTSRGGADRPGLRVSPHFYNTPEEVDRLVARARRVSRRRGCTRARPPGGSRNARNRKTRSLADSWTAPPFGSPLYCVA